MSILQEILQNDIFNELNIEEIEQLKIFKEIQLDLLTNGRITKKILDSRGNKIFDDNTKKMRGGKPYFPPKNWFGIGIKVSEKYDKGDDTWLGNKNNKGEWCVAYHGMGKYSRIKNMYEVLYNIIYSSLKPGPIQTHSNCEDIYHPGVKVGIGVGLTPKIEIAEGYAGTIEINKKNYKIVLMLRVNPEKIRACSCYDNWTLNGTPDEIRVYRILFKEC